MKNFKTFYSLLFSSIFFFASSSVSAQPERWNILMLGDSITEWSTSIIGGYPEQYTDDLRAIYGEDTTFNFIGRVGQVDARREGYNGKTSNFIRRSLKPGSDNGMYEFLQQNIPDVVLLHIGTNDVWKFKSSDEVESNIRQIIGSLKGINPEVHVCLAKIIPWRALFLAPFGDIRVVQYNQRIGNIGNDTDNVTIVDQYSGYIPFYSLDGIHPNAQGAAKMAFEWISQCPQVYQYE